MKAFILAAGFGKRMESYTKNLPKPMLSIQDVKLLDYTLYLIHRWKISDILVNTHYLSEKIENYLKSFIHVNIQISREKKILGTGGGIFTGIHKFGNRFIPHTISETSRQNNLIDRRLDDEIYIIINPDTILLPDSDSFFPKFPLGQNKIDEFNLKSLCHLYLLPLPQKASYTGLFLKNGKVVFEPVEESVACYYIGLAVMKTAWMDSSDSKYEIDQPFELIEVFKKLSEKGLLTGEIFSGRAIDIGEKEFYESILKIPDFFQGKKQDILSTIQSMKE